MRSYKGIDMKDSQTEYDMENASEKSPIVPTSTPKTRTTCNKKKICFGIYAAILFVGLVAWLTIWIQWMDEARQNEPWLKKDVYNGDRRRLNALRQLNALRYHRPKHRKCADYDYGCCHVYYNCDISDQGKLVSDTMTVTPYDIVQHDEHGTNCPRLLDMISGFNYHYPDGEGPDLAFGRCTDSEFGCCDINYTCDLRMRFSYQNDINYTKALWLNDLEKKQTRTSLTVAKRDAVGSNCPRVGNIVNKYEHGFPIEISDMWFYCLFGIIVVCAICSTRKSK
jgi:hypothetical protein